MENKSLKHTKKRLVVPVAIAVLVMLSIVIVLANNKKKLDQAAEPVDRTIIPVSVTVAESVIKPLHQDIEYPAITQPYEEAKLYAQTNGMIASLNIELGQHVTKGQLLGRLDTRVLQNNLKAAEISLRSAQTNRQKLLDDYSRAKDLYENKAGLEVNMLSAKNNYDNALNSEENARVQIQLIKEQIAHANLIAPVSGIVSANKVMQGEFVSPSTPIATISNISTVKATVFVNQELSYHLKSNQTARITLPLFPEETFSGKIIFINPVADANHNYQVDLLVANNHDTKLKAGTDVQVSFNTLTQDHALIIPKQALVTDARQPYVYVAENGKAIKKDIGIGVIKNDEVQVLSGLTAGEKIITSGQINLSTGSLISFK